MVSRIPEAYWRSVLNPGVLNVLMVVPEQMSLWDLWSYIDHLSENRQETSRYQIVLCAPVGAKVVFRTQLEGPTGRKYRLTPRTGRQEHECPAWRYEIDNRPEWVGVPLAGIAAIAGVPA